MTMMLGAFTCAASTGSSTRWHSKTAVNKSKTCLPPIRLPFIRSPIGLSFVSRQRRIHLTQQRRINFDELAVVGHHAIDFALDIRGLCVYRRRHAESLFHRDKGFNLMA